MFKPRVVVIALTAIVLALVVSTLVVSTQVYGQATVTSTGGCKPTSTNRPICPSTATLGTASFIDPTTTINNPGNITLGQKVYVAPFATLNATNGPIRIEEESNVQDQVTILASGTGVTIGPRVIAAHRATVKGAAKVGTQGSTGPFTDRDTNAQFSNNPAETFLSFGSEVDGAIVEKNTLLQPLSRVGPGVTLPAGKVVLPGKNVTDNNQATNGSAGKVVNLAQADVTLMEGIIEVNEAFAKGYTDLARKDLSNVRGINYAPVTSFNPGGLPEFNGKETRDPNFRNRIIGKVLAEDPLLTFNVGNRVSLRADEGEPFKVGSGSSIADNVVFHALEETNLTLGDAVGYGNGALVHGGRQVVNGADTGPETSLGNGVGLARNSVVFRSVIGDASAVGEKSAVLNSTLGSATAIGPRTIYGNNGAVISRVEW